MRAAIVLLLVCSVGSSAQAQDYEGARLLGTAGTMRALASTNDAIYANPAGIALGRVYNVELNAQDDLDGGSRLFNASVVDSQAGPLAAGIGYVYTKRTVGDTPAGERTAKAHRGDLSLATRVSQSAAIGVTARYVSEGEKVNEVDDEDGGLKLFTVDAGFQWRSEAGLSLGLVAYNLTNSDETGFPISWGAGLAYAKDWLAVEGDVRYNAKVGKARYSGAVNVLLADTFPVRAGAYYDLADNSVVAAGGVGYQNQGFGADIGYRQRVRDGDLPSNAPGERAIGIAIRATFK